MRRRMRERGREMQIVQIERVIRGEVNFGSGKGAKEEHERIGREKQKPSVERGHASEIAGNLCNSTVTTNTIPLTAISAMASILLAPLTLVCSHICFLKENLFLPLLRFLGWMNRAF